jgi:predicted DCC family thiol-disulfide oxidoreductase YuxK
VESGAAATALLLLGVALAACFAIGLGDRVAAVALVGVGACLFALDPLIADPGLPFAGALLLAHACIPCAPFGAWSARGREDPAGGWRMSPRVFGAAWAVMALGYAHSGYGRLVNLPEGAVGLATWSVAGMELLFAPLALFARARPWLWLLLLGSQAARIALSGSTGPSMAMVMLHLFTFDPRWVSPRRGDGVARLFYDGDCGLCHAAVRWVISEDPEGRAFRFAPLHGRAFEQALPAERRGALPDSLVVVLQDGTVHTRAGAVRQIGHRLGGAWRALAIASSAIPTPWLDRAYDAIARVRHRLFARPAAACPVSPEPLRARFD